MNLAGKKINFLGDSITFGYSLNSEDEVYHQVLLHSAGLASARNYGINGSRIARQSALDDTGPCFAERWCDMDDDADVIVVFGGTNDQAHGDAPIGLFSDRTSATFYGALHVLISGLKSKYPNAVIVFMTPLHRTEENEPNKATEKLLIDYVNIIKEVTAFYHIPVLDLHNLCEIQPNNKDDREHLCPDGIHPNAAGQQMVANCLLDFLERL